MQNEKVSRISTGSWIVAREVDEYPSRAPDRQTYSTGPVLFLRDGVVQALPGIERGRVIVTVVRKDPSRSELYRRIDDRVRHMFALGLVDEVRQLVANGIPRSAKAFEAIGYRHVLADLDSCIEMEETIRIIQRDTRRYAKRQMTWFRNQPNVTWFNGPGDDEEIKNKVRQFVQPFLKF